MNRPKWVLIFIGCGFFFLSSSFYFVVSGDGKNHVGETETNETETYQEVQASKSDIPKSGELTPKEELDELLLKANGSKIEEQLIMMALYSLLPDKERQEIEEARQEKLREDDRKKYNSINVIPHRAFEVSCPQAVEPVSSLPIVTFCDRVYLEPKHAYFSYEIETLENMAHGDALAAAVLSERLAKSNLDNAEFWARQSTILSGKPGPLTHHARNLIDAIREIEHRDLVSPLNKKEAEALSRGFKSELRFRSRYFLLAGFYLGSPYGDYLNLDKPKVVARAKDFVRSLASKQEIETGSTSIKKSLTHRGVSTSNQ